MYQSDALESPVQVELQRVGMLSVAKVAALFYGGMAFILALFYGLMLAAVGAVGLIQGEPEALLGVGIGAVFLIALPFVYGMMGAVVGALMAGLYNLVAGRVGGLRFTFSPTFQEV